MRYLLSIWFIFSVTLLQAQNVNVTIDCPRVVRVGEPFQMEVQVDANSSKPVFPDTDAFSILRELGSSQSQQINVVNNRMTRSVQFVYSYIVQANKEGTQELGPAEVTVDKKTYQSSAVPVQVVAGQQQGSGTSGAQTGNEQVNTDNRNLFLEVLTDRTKIYQGEFVTATLKLFSKQDISSLGNLIPPSFESFIKQEVETPPLRSLTRETINGEVYGTGLIRQTILFPQKSGTLAIGSYTMEVGVPQRVQTRSRSIWDDIMGGIQTVPYELTSRPVNITVLPLPDNKPSSFTGGVGQLKFNVAVDKTELKANDPITLKMTISGTGNIKYTDPPKINFPPDFEVYEPKINTSLNPQSTSGSKTFEYLIIPRHGGNYKIPAIEFSYFDPQAKQYKTLSSEEQDITVEKGEEQPGTTVISGVTREDVKFLGKDIRYIKTDQTKLRLTGNDFFGSWKFWLWYLIPLLGFVTVVYLRRNYIRKYANTALVKNKKANSFASKRLKRAKAFADKDQKEDFYEELSRALWGYLSDKLTIPVAELSRDNVRSILEQHHTDMSLSDEFIGVIDDCEFARYAPSASGTDVHTLYNKAVDVIGKMQKVI